jgi:uncharacterized membrane protein YadS
VRTAGVLPGAVIDGARTAEGWFLTVALLGLGTGVRLRRLRTVGTRGVVLGLVAFVFVAGLAYLGVVAVHGTARLAG